MSKFVRVEVERRDALHGECYINANGNFRRAGGSSGIVEDVDVLVRVVGEPKDEIPDWASLQASAEEISLALREIAVNTRVQARATVMQAANDAIHQCNPGNLPGHDDKGFDSLLALLDGEGREWK